VLVPIELESGADIRVADNRAGHGTRKGYRLARTILVCNHHPGGITNGPPPETPRRTLAPGTTRKEPQLERLFDVQGYKCSAWRLAWRSWS
jgi:hypothetical protein